MDLSLLGLVQGLTEFFPISSSGHLWLVQYFRGVTPDLTLEVLLHLASLGAVVWVYRGRIGELMRELLGSQESGVRSQSSQLPHKLLWATLLTFPLAYIGKQFLDGGGMTLMGVVWSLWVTAGLVVVSHFWKIGKGADFTWTKASIVGIVQGLAILPGISRSGLTIVILLLLGIPRQKSLEISFLLAIPTILGAVAFDLLDLESWSWFTRPDFYLAAFICFLASLGAITFMKRTIERYWLWWGGYCGVLGLVLMMVGQ